jgi:hypothetical protein
VLLGRAQLKHRFEHWRKKFVQVISYCRQYLTAVWLSIADIISRTIKLLKAIDSLILAIATVILAWIAYWQWQALQGCFVYQTFKEIHHSAFCYFYHPSLINDLPNLGICGAGNSAEIEATATMLPGIVRQSRSQSGTFLRSICWRFKLTEDRHERRAAQRDSQSCRVDRRG